jgi:hypothetical protein
MAASPIETLPQWFVRRNRKCVAGIDRGYVSRGRCDGSYCGRSIVLREE